jgi:hypothetical protein
MKHFITFINNIESRMKLYKCFYQLNSLFNIDSFIIIRSTGLIIKNSIFNCSVIFYKSKTLKLPN